MSYFTINYGNRYRSRIREFVADSDADISDLPTNTKEGVKQLCDEMAHLKCDIGSKCLVITGSVYILNSAGEWKKFGA